MGLATNERIEELSARMDLTTLRRGLLILLTLGEPGVLESGGWGTSEIARHLGLDKSQVSRTLRVLEETDLVERDPSSRRYRLGLEMYRLGVRGVDQRLIRTSAPILISLVHKLNIRAFLVARAGPVAITIWSAESQKTNHAPNNIGTVHLIARSTTGRALMLASSSEEIRSTILNSPGIFTEGEVARFIDQVATDRHRGYSVGQSKDVGMVNLAVPVWGAGRSVRAVIGISGPFNQLNESTDAVAMVVKAAAAALSSALRNDREGTNSELA